MIGFVSESSLWQSGGVVPGWTGRPEGNSIITQVGSDEDLVENTN
jgi:hypothetical protein